MEIADGTVYDEDGTQVTLYKSVLATDQPYKLNG
jgi:hypothetical protein